MRYDAYPKPLNWSVWSWMRVRARGGVFDPYVVMQVGAGQKVIQLPRRAAQLEARLHRVVASAVEVDAASVLEHALRLYLDHPCLPVAVLGRQRPGQEVDPLGEPGVEGLAETGNPLGEGHAVDAVLNVGVVSPYMELAVGVIGHTRRLKQYLVEGGLLPLGERSDIVLGYRIFAPSGLRRQAVPRLGQPLRRDGHFKGFLRGQGQRRRGRRSLLLRHDGGALLKAGLFPEDRIRARLDAGKDKVTTGIALSRAHGLFVGRLQCKTCPGQGPSQGVLDGPLDFVACRGLNFSRQRQKSESHYHARYYPYRCSHRILLSKLT